MLSPLSPCPPSRTSHHNPTSYPTGANMIRIDPNTITRLVLTTDAPDAAYWHVAPGTFTVDTATYGTGPDAGPHFRFTTTDGRNISGPLAALAYTETKTDEPVAATPPGRPEAREEAPRDDASAPGKRVGPGETS